MTKVTTMKGKILDMGQIMAQNEKTVAIGNARMNARGDMLGAGGQIVKRREQVAQEYHSTNPKAVQKISLKDVETDVFLTPAQAVEQATKAAQAIKPKTKKIVDSDD
jgi:ATP-dependent protease ClpP protease subunit